MPIGRTRLPCSSLLVWRSLVWSSLVPLLALVLLLRSTALALRIQVCQNKDCCRRFRGASTLPRILKDLNLDVTTTGCLTLCNQGPNVVVTRNDADKKQYLHLLVDPMTAVIAMESISGPISPKLKAAIQVMEAGQTGM